MEIHKKEIDDIIRNVEDVVKNQISKISDDFFVFGNFVHAVLSDIIVHKINMSSYNEIVKNLILFTELREKDFFLKLRYFSLCNLILYS